MAAAGGIGEIVYAVALEYERGLEDILQLGIGNKAFLAEEGVCLSGTACPRATGGHPF